MDNVNYSHENFDKTTEFFNNIPDFQGETILPFTLTNKNDGVGGSSNFDLFRACELFLVKNRIRPDFFCKYKSALKWVIFNWRNPIKLIRVYIV